MQVCSKFACKHLEKQIEFGKWKQTSGSEKSRQLSNKRLFTSFDRTLTNKSKSFGKNEKIHDHQAKSLAEGPSKVESTSTVFHSVSLSLKSTFLLTVNTQQMAEDCACFKILFYLLPTNCNDSLTTHIFV